ncbi:MAG: thioredoxin [Bacteroidales bacterium]|nr:thioredoxin [Bacteroidales bacterium]MBR4120106.1 thioredoxin [Bacteroidales bacterium]
MATIHLTKDEFLKRVSNIEENGDSWKFLGDKPAVVDFYAQWCGPCKALSPILDEVSDEYAGKVDIYKVDVDQEEDLAVAFGIRTIPTLLFIPMGKNPQIMVGGLPKNKLKEVIDSIL